MLIWVFYLPWGQRCHENRFSHHSCSTFQSWPWMKYPGEQSFLQSSEAGEGSKGKWDGDFTVFQIGFQIWGKIQRLERKAHFLVYLGFGCSLQCHFFLQLAEYVAAQRVNNHKKKGVTASKVQTRSVLSKNNKHDLVALAYET